MRTPILAYVMLLLAVHRTFGESPGCPSAAPGLVNGVYCIIRQCSGQQTAPKLGSHERAVPVASEDAPAETLVLSDSPEVVLDLAGEPRLTTRSDGVEVLSVELDRVQAASLLKMTTRLLNQRIAIVVDDVVVMCPRVRTPIKDGRFEISAGHVDLVRLKESLWPVVPNELRR